AATLWKALIAAGEPYGIQPAGLGARDTLRLEARLSLYGNEIDETTTPIEAGLGWVVKLDKGDFIGREAIARVKEQGPAKRLVGFEMTGRGIGRHGYPILDSEGQRIGVVTSGGPGPAVGKNIGLGYVPREMSRVGTRIGVEIRGKVVDAVIVKTPFYKRRK
ncbi:MAG: aminomethyltransferase family protein, partial [Myxococcota bacterium]